MTRRPERIDRYHIPRRILKETRDYLRRFGRCQREGFLCWSGTIQGEREAVIRSCIFPPGFRPMDSSFVALSLGLHRVFEIGRQVAEKGELIFAQVHSHPEEAFHSWIDDQRPLSHQVGFLSIVVPHFGMVALDDFSECRIYKYLGHSRWREFSPDEVQERFVIIQSTQRLRRWIQSWKGSTPGHGF